MSKFNKLYFSLIVTSILSVIGCVAGSAAWFMGMEEVSMGNTNGYTEASYFASGDGSEAKPFIITNKVHMYNLAWLQYLGQFNKIDEETGKVKQTYFRIGMEENNPITVDMTDMVLPPIGTEANPFLGNFDGNGSTLTNYIVSNKIDDNNITKKPLKVTNIDEVKIVGIFGVVGDIDSTYEGKYSSAVLNISDLYISKAEVKTYSSQSLIGIAAGYVNGTIDGVGVINSTVNVATSSSAYTALGKTTNISDYTLIGYCEEDYRANTVKATTSIGSEVGRKQKFVVEEDGDVSGWGGSIDMKSMHERILAKYTGSSTPGNFVYVKNVINDGGTEIIDNENQASGYHSNGNNAFTYHYSSSNDAGSYYVGTGGSNAYLYLYQETMTVKNYDRSHVDGMRIQHNGNYLMMNGSTVSTTTRAANATSFVYDGTRIYYMNGYEITYLNGANGNLSASTSSSTTWRFDNTRNIYYVNVNNTNMYLQYDNGWKLMANNQIRYRISSGTNYLSNNGTNVTNTNKANSTLWTFSNTGTNPSGTISTEVNGTTYYLSTGNNNSLSLSAQSQTFVNDANKLYYRRNNWNNRYIRYNNGWTSTTDAQNGTTLTFESVTVSSLTLTTVSTTVDTFVNSHIENSSYPTCFPLNTEKTAPYNVKDSNTGYVISGGYSPKSSSGRGDIRVSRYAISGNISNSYNVDNRNFTTVYTINNSGSRETVGETHSFAKYDSAKSKMLNVLSGQTNVFGLHFMDAAITMDHMVTAPKAVINGVTYNNYQFPNDCVDFNLKEKGHINFFAGTYYGGNSSFFSLHKIYRDSSSNITAIKEIRRIYESNNAADDYLYQFTDGTYSTGGTTFPNGYKNTALFDTNVLTNPGSALRDSYVYYFEIPCDAGEYALGSVSGKDGAYLMYLDISANAREIARSEFMDTVKITEGHTSYPLGVSAVVDSNSAVDPSDSFFVSLSSSFTSTQTINRTGLTNATITKTNSASLVYKKDEIEVRDANSAIVNETAPLSVTNETSRVIYADVNTATREAYYFYAIKETNGSTTSYKYEAYQLQEDGSLLDVTDSFTLYDWDGHTQSLTDSTLRAFGFKDLANINKTILSYSYERAEVDEFTFEYKIKLSEIDPDGNDFFVSLLGYEIDANNSGGKTLTIQVSTKDNNLTFTYVGMSEA